MNRYMIGEPELDLIERVILGSVAPLSVAMDRHKALTMIAGLRAQVRDYTEPVDLNPKQASVPHWSIKGGECQCSACRAERGEIAGNYPHPVEKCGCSACREAVIQTRMQQKNLLHSAEQERIDLLNECATLRHKNGCLTKANLECSRMASRERTRFNKLCQLLRDLSTPDFAKKIIDAVEEMDENTDGVSLSPDRVPSLSYADMPPASVMRCAQEVADYFAIR